MVFCTFPQTTPNKEDLEYLLCDYGHQEDYKNIQPVKSLREAVTMDDKSPVCLKYLGDSYRKTRNIALAEECYKKALLVLPEYGEASFALAMLYRSELNNHLAIPHFIDAFTAPFYFIKDKAKILQLLSRYSDDNLYDKNDPVWKRRYMFKLDEGEKYPNFHRIINEVIEEYMEKGEFKRAIGLRLFLGTFARSDERLVHRYQLRDHQMLLCQNLETAGFNKRIPLLGL